jgi:hypothetical protein
MEHSSGFQPPPNAEEQPAAARIVQSRDLLGENNGVALCNETGGSAELDSSSGSRERDQRVRNLPQVVWLWAMGACGTYIRCAVRDGEDRVIRHPIGFESERLGMLCDHSWVGTRVR